MCGGLEHRVYSKVVGWISHTQFALAQLCTSCEMAMDKPCQWILTVGRVPSQCAARVSCYMLGCGVRGSQRWEVLSSGRTDELVE